MPVTPYHFGFGLAAQALFPKRLSFACFCFSQVIIDLEPGYYFLKREYPFHRFAHTLIGAALIAIAVTLVVLPIYQKLSSGWPGRPKRLTQWLRDDLGSPKIILISAFLGTMSHVLLDALVHKDVLLFAPFSKIYPLWGYINYSQLKSILLILGVGSLFLVCLKSRKTRGL